MLLNKWTASQSKTWSCQALEELLRSDHYTALHGAGTATFYMA
jgi:hypothetical protein